MNTFYFFSRHARKGFLSLLVLGALALTALAAEQLYTCGMHPQIIKKEPGNCPICGMRLTPIRTNDAGANNSASTGERVIRYYRSTMIPGEVSDQPGKDSMGMEMVPVYENEGNSASAIRIDAATIQRMNLKTGLVERGPVRREIRAVGAVTYNEEGLRDITTKYEGWIEHLYVNATWTTVQAGDPLFEIYSPDLYNAQLNYLVARQSEGSESGPLTRAALARLRLFDISDSFIEEITASGEPKRTYLFRAPSSGVVIDKMAVEGQMMKPGERIYRLADLSTVWVQAQIYESDLPFVSEGQSATVRTTYGAERSYSGTVDLLLPEVEERTRAATARLVLENPNGSLRPGMFVDVRLTAQLSESAVLVPDIAVLRSGERNTVFVARSDGSFEPRSVQLGSRSEGNFYEVLSGLQSGERIVTSGQFMLDSESQLREAIQKMLRGASGGDSGDAEMEMTRSMPLEDADPLRKLALAAANASESLAAENLASYQTDYAALRATLESYIEAHPHAAHAFPDIPDDPSSGYPSIEAARKDFEPLSTAIADLVRENHTAPLSGLHIMQCPMSPVLGAARWLQHGSEPRNPFLGADMLGCGEEIVSEADAHSH